MPKHRNASFDSRSKISQNGRWQWRQKSTFRCNLLRRIFGIAKYYPHSFSSTSLKNRNDPIGAPKYPTTQLEKTPKISNLRRRQQLRFTTSWTQLPTRHVRRTTKDLHEKGLNVGGSGAPRNTAWKETHDGQKTQPVSGAHRMLQSPPLNRSRSTHACTHARTRTRTRPHSTNRRATLGLRFGRGAASYLNTISRSAKFRHAQDRKKVIFGANYSHSNGRVLAPPGRLEVNLFERP